MPDPTKVPSRAYALRGYPRTKITELNAVSKTPDKDSDSLWTDEDNDDDLVMR
jgi:hypothetical protein